jgi:hypothetical protein
LAKLTAVIVGVLVFYVMAFSFLPSSFSPIINWLGPVFGVSLQVLLSLLFFIFASPFTYPVVLVTWILVGVLVGVFTRTLKGALSAAPAVLSFALTLLGIAFGGLLSGLSKSGITSGNFPPPPEGTNVATIFNVPVFNKIAPLIIGSISGGSGLNIGTTTSSLVPILVVPLLENIVILFASAIVVGFGLGFVLKKTKSNRAKKMHSDNASPQQITTTAAVAIILLFLFAGLFGAPTSFAQGGFYSETVLATVGTYGNSTNYYAFGSSSLVIPNSQGAFSSMNGVVFAVEVSQVGGFGLLPSSLASQFQSVVSLLPPSMVIIGLYGTCDSTSSSASSLEAGFASAYSMNDLSQLVCANVPASNMGLGNSNGNNVAVYAYQSSIPMNSIAQFMANTIDPLIQSSGLIEVFNTGLSSGFLVPGASPSSVTKSVLLSGYASVDFLKQIPVVGSFFNGAQGGLIGFSGAITSKANALHSSSAVHSVSFAQLTNYNGSVSFSPNSIFSIAGVGVPLTNLQSNVQALSDLNLTLYTNNPSVTKSILSSQASSQIQIVSLQQGESVQSSQMQASFTKLLPANLSVVKTITAQSDGTVLVTISVNNLDTDQVTNLALNDQAFLNSYPSSLTLVSGNPLNSATSSLAPGASVSYTYSIRPSGVGTYVALPAQVSYQLNGTTFTAYSNTAQYSTAPATAESSLSALISSEGSSIDSIIGTSAGTGALIIILVLVALVVLAGFMEYRSYAKWRKA